MSDSVRPHRWQPTRLPCPWDSPGKNTGVGCHCLLQCMKVKSESEVTQSCPTPSHPMDCSPPGSSIHGIFQARVLEWGATAFSGLSLHLQIFPTYDAVKRELSSSNWNCRRNLNIHCSTKKIIRLLWENHSLKNISIYKNHEIRMNVKLDKAS